MTPFSDVQRIHLTGIKGVAMTAFAQCLVDMGKTVEGSDLAEEFVTQGLLNTLSVHIHTGFSPEHLHENTDLLIFSAAHNGSKNPEVVEAKKRNIPTLSHAEALGELMKEKIGVSVCGVGGKSTVSAMIAWILERVGKKPSFAVGVGNIFNLKRTGRYVDETPYFVAEADEYANDPGTDDTPRFQFQYPQVIVCTNLEYDHPDIYASFEDTKRAYLEFFRNIPDGGTLVINGNNENLQTVADVFDHERKKQGKEVTLISLSDRSDHAWHYASTYASELGKTSREFWVEGKKHLLEISLPGAFNLQNALYAVVAVVQLGVPLDRALEAIKEFKGTMRRFEDKGVRNGVQYYDDYAHHPSEIQVTLKALREWYPNRKIIAFFQPHTFSRTKALLKEFAQSFADADEVILLEIFASAREKFDPTVSSALLAQEVSAHGTSARYIKTLDEAKAYLFATAKSTDVVILLGAGDIYTILE